MSFHHSIVTALLLISFNEKWKRNLCDLDGIRYTFIFLPKFNLVILYWKRKSTGSSNVAGIQYLFPSRMKIEILTEVELVEP